MQGNFVILYSATVMFSRKICHFFIYRRHKTANGGLFADFQALQRIWTHPYVLKLNQDRQEKANEKKRLEASDSEGSLRDFIDDDSESSSSSSSSSDVQCLDSDEDKVEPQKRSTRNNPLGNLG